ERCRQAVHPRGVDVEAVLQRDVELGVRSRRADSRRLRLHRRVPGRAVPARRAGADHLRGHQRDSAAGGRPRDLQEGERMRAIAVVALFLVACGPKPKPIPDSGMDEDGGTDAGTMDAGRMRGDEPPTGWSVALPPPEDAGVTARYGVSAS